MSGGTAVPRAARGPLAVLARHRTELVIGAVAVLVRLVAAWHFLPDHMVEAYGGGDGVEYHRLAVEISRGHWFGHPLFIARPPGLPLAVGGLDALLGTSSASVMVGLSICCSSLAAIVSHRIASLAGLDPTRALLVGLAVAIDPSFVLVGIAPLSDALFGLACISVAMFVLEGRRDGFSKRSVAGVAASLVIAVLTKPSALFLWIVPVFVLVRARRFVPAVVVVAAVAVTAGAWTARNYAETRIPTYSSISTTGLLFFRAAGTEVRAEGKDYLREVKPEIERELARRLGFTTVKPLEFYKAPTERRVHDEQLALAVDIIRRHPVQYLAAIPVGLSRLFFRAELVPAGRWDQAVSGLYVLLYAVAGITWFRVRRADPFVAWLVAAFVAYFGLTTVAVVTSGFGGTRLALPFLPLVFVTAAWAGRTPAAG